MHSRVRVKFCGMTREQDIEDAINLGVDAIGVILTEKSKRGITISRARELCKIIPAFVDLVTVLVDPNIDTVNRVLDEIPLQFIQFHGSEDKVFCEQFHHPYIKAIPAKSNQFLKQNVSEFSSAAAILIDTPTGATHGGSGLTFDWDIIPSNVSKSIILAGGLNIDNVVQAINKIKPYAIDVCSGIEKEFGIKEVTKMKQFIDKVKSNE